MKAIIHIGSPKTGSSTIQQYLDRNRQPLKMQSIFIPSYSGAGHVQLAAMAVIFGAKISKQSSFVDCIEKDLPLLVKENKALSPEDQDRLWKKCRHEIETNCGQGDLVIFSTERLFQFHAKEVERVKNLLDSLFDDVSIVLYLRRQPEYLISSLFNSIWQGKSCTWPPSALPEYDKAIKRWSIFGKDKIKIRIFDKQKFHDNDLLSDFAITCGFSMAGLERVENMNESRLGSAETEFLRLFNSHVPKMLDLWTRNPDRESVRPVLLSLQSKTDVKPKAFHVNREEARQILEQCREGNDWIAREYLGREKLFDEDVSMFPEEVASPHGLTLEKCAEITAYLWKDRCGAVRELQQENRRIAAERDASNAELQLSSTNLALLQQKKSIYWHYYRSKVLAMITFGKKHKGYKEKRNALHEQVRKIRELHRYNR